DYVIEGGQTMNPSTEDILKACDEVNAKDIFILPNNKNIILAANQAKELLEGKTLHVIPSKTIPQGISAMISFSPDLSASDNEKVMSEATGTVKTAEVTYAVRDTSIEGHPIIKNDIMVLGDDGLLSVDKDIHSAVLAGIKRMASDDAEIITLYYGADTKEEDAEALGEELRKLYPQMETEVQRGGQPIYYYFISVE
ncbi:MAG: DAK2 domain-containing protein, partial [Oribacterium sp.]|nr:DAK2 domain-containing protein [Oribacterium sp.]